MCNLLTDVCEIVCNVYRIKHDVYRIVCNVYRIKHDVCGIVCNVYIERVSLCADGVQRIAQVYFFCFCRKSKILASPCFSSTQSTIASMRINKRPAHDVNKRTKKWSSLETYNTRESTIVITTDISMKNTPARQMIRNIGRLIFVVCSAWYNSIKFDSFSFVFFMNFLQNYSVSRRLPKNYHKLFFCAFGTTF